MSETTSDSQLGRAAIMATPFGRELDKVVHRVVFKGEISGDGFIVNADGSIGTLQHYSTKTFDALDVEAEVTRLGLAGVYAERLLALLGCSDDEFTAATFVRMLHATPDKRCRAALLAVSGIDPDF